MLDNDRIAVAVLNAAKRHPAVARRNDRRPGRRGVVDATVRANGIEHRMPAIQIEA